MDRGLKKLKKREVKRVVTQTRRKRLGGVMGKESQGQANRKTAKICRPHLSIQSIKLGSRDRTCWMVRRSIRDNWC